MSMRDDSSFPEPEETESTLYRIADEAIRRCIEVYLQLMKVTQGLSQVKKEHVKEKEARTILLAGLGVDPRKCDADRAVEEWKRRQAIPFDIEHAVTIGVYDQIRTVGARFLEEVERATNGFRDFSPQFIHENPQLLPLFQHIAGVFSKAALKKKVGSVSDTSISKPAAERLSALLKERVDPSGVNKGEVLQRLESTLEGIVRDLVGRVLLESIVASALTKQRLPFKREEEYEALRGVVYDFRADFVLPDAENPMVFIEVRKSSSRHASLYAKDKMFSAINWKGKNPDLLGVLVVDGEWTGETLRVMAKVFDYVVPIGRVAELVKTIDAYLSGDKSKLKWLIQFQISEANP